MNGIIRRIKMEGNAPPILTYMVSAAIVLLATALLTGGLPEQKAYAVDGTLDQTLCESDDFGGSWLDGADMCTLFGEGGVFINSGETLTIPSGVTLVVFNNVDGSTGINNFGTIENQGVLTMANIDNSFGIGNFGTINNNGVVTVIDASGSTGIYNFGTITSFGTIDIQNFDDSYGILNDGGHISNSDLGTMNFRNSDVLINRGVFNINGGAIDNSGIINFLNPGSNGIWVDGGTITNTGTMNFQNSGDSAGNSGITIIEGTLINHDTIDIANTGFGSGINNFGTMENHATINIENSDSDFNRGIFNVDSLINSGTITVANSDEIGILNSGTITNSGTIDIQSSGLAGISGSVGDINNSGTINIQNSAGLGISNFGGSFANSGTVTVANSGPTGIYLRGNTAQTATFNNGGILDVESGGTLFLDSIVTLGNDGTITNAGVISMTSLSTLHNHVAGTITNSGVIINECGTFVNEGTFTGNPVSVICDTDDDGIRDNVDTQPNTFSSDFDDAGIGGTTNGTIVTRGDQQLIVMEAPNPDGVEIYANTTGGGVNPAEVSACAGSALYTINSFDDIIVTCGSVTTEVFEGPVEVVFTGDDGATASATLEEGFAVTFAPDTFSFTAPESNPGPISITIGGNTVTIEAGETVQLVTVSIDIKPGGTPNAINIKKDKIVTVALLGSSTFDVNTVDKTTLLFGGHSLQTPTRTSLQNVDKDGYMDLVMQFSVPPLDFTVEDTKGCLTGLTPDGVPFMGCDSVRILNK